MILNDMTPEPGDSLVPAHAIDVRIGIVMPHPQRGISPDGMEQ